jgi:hypothetical protein
MRRWIGWASRLYPPAWKRRYGAEFEALLEESSLRCCDLTDVLREALKMHLASWKTYAATAGLAGAVGAALAAAAWPFEPKQYTSTVVFRVAPERPVPLRQPASTAVTPLSLHTRGPINDRFLAEIVADPKLDLYREDQQRLPMLDVLENMATRDIQTRVTDDGTGTLWVVSFSYPDRYKAQQTARVLAERLEGADFRSLPVPSHLFLAAPPQLPQRPDGPPLSTFAVFGLAAGLLLGVLAVAIWHKPQSCLKLVVCGAAGALLEIGISCLVPQNYVSTAVLLAQPPETDPGALEKLEQQVLGLESLTSLVNRDQLALYGMLPWRNALEIAQRMSRDLRIERTDAPSLGLAGLRISFVYRDPLKAQVVVRELTTQFISTNFRNDGYSVSSSRRRIRLDVQESPSLPEIPEGPSRLPFALAGVALGFLAGPPMWRAWRTGGSAVSPA